MTTVLESSVLEPTASRSNSLASVASSGASLARRSRTRTRARTLVGTSHPKSKQPSSVPADQLARELERLVSPTTLDATDVRSGVKDMSPKDAQNLSGDVCSGPDASRPGKPQDMVKDVRIGLEERSRESTIRRVRDWQDTGHGSDHERGREVKWEEVSKSVKTRRRVSSLPRLTTPSDHRPTREERVHHAPNDSVVTQQSSTSSSLYPLSTPTETESSASPHSLAAQEYDQGRVVTSYDLDDDEGPHHEFDVDDVSYRLRLLVKNNYFLPPAHSKPSQLDLLPPSPNPVKKLASPTFLDIFRVGKSKSKPTTPDGKTGLVEQSAPVLRTTSDSTTASGYFPRRNAWQPQMPTHPRPIGVLPERHCRVVVVREKVDDLVSAVQQVELEMKAREVRQDREKGSRAARQDEFDGVIDPTDAVDIPPPSANYPFALQAAALHGLGVHDSVGAAALADRLPPPGSPLSTLDPKEEAWRKAILHQAVNHSLNNSTASSNASMSMIVSTPSSTSRRIPSQPSLSSHNDTFKGHRRRINQQIVATPVIDNFDVTSNAGPPPAASHAPPLSPNALSAIPFTSDPEWASRDVPHRAETPVPHNPLPPPPRREIGNPLFSRSQTDIPNAVKEGYGSSGESSTRLRKALSSPLLSGESRTGVAMTPPPMPSVNVSPAPSTRMSSDRPRGTHRLSIATSGSRYSGSEVGDIIIPADEPPPRPSMSLSIPTTDGRPSLSEYSQPSPTASAFYDRWPDAEHQSSSNLHRSFDNTQYISRESFSMGGPTPRFSTTSPPPRPSSSVANIALSPPPRSTFLKYKTLSAMASHSISSDYSSQPAPQTISEQLEVPRMQRPLAIDPSISNLPVIHSVPPPSSPLEFFDYIQSHPNAMDDLDSSDDSESEADHEMSPAVPSRHQEEPIQPPRPFFMRFGNQSTPNVQRPLGIHSNGSTTSITLGRGIGNVSPHAPVSSCPSESAGPVPISPPPSISGHPRELSLSPGSYPRRRPATAGAETSSTKGQRSQDESLKRLDGLLVQHIEAERDTFRRITRTLAAPKS